MKIAIVRGDFAAPAELPNFFPMSKQNTVTLFTGQFPVWNLGNTEKIKVEKLFSPVDFNFGKISRWKMAILNRIFTDAHYLLGLESKLTGYDVAHSADTYYGFTQQCINTKEKGHIKIVVSTVWENIAFNNESIPGRKEFKKKAFEKIDRFLAVTSKAKDILIEEGCNPRKIEVLMPGVDLEIFRKTSTKFSFPKDAKNKIKLVFSGRLVQEKGIIELLDFYSKAKSKNEFITFIIAGEGPLKKEINKKILNENLKDVHLLGKISYKDMPKLYSSCDLLLHYPIGSKTWQEQYGMSLIEAMACGLPVLALDKGSVKEVVGEGGIVIAENEFENELLKLLAKNNFKGMSFKAQSFARKKYDSHVYAKRLQEIYSELLTG